MWWNDGNESIDDRILNQWMTKEWWCGIWNKQRNRVSIEYSLIIERSGMEWNECVDPMMELPTVFDTISENGRNIYEWNQINQTILEIDFDWTHWNEKGSLTFRRFGISKYHQYSIFRNTFQCHWTRKSETFPFRIDNGC